MNTHLSWVVSEITSILKHQGNGSHAIPNHYVGRNTRYYLQKHLHNYKNTLTVLILLLQSITFLGFDTVKETRVNNRVLSNECLDTRFLHILALELMWISNKIHCVLVSRSHHNSVYLSPLWIESAEVFEKLCLSAVSKTGSRRVCVDDLKCIQI